MGDNRGCLSWDMDADRRAFDASRGNNGHSGREQKATKSRHAFMNCIPVAHMWRKHTFWLRTTME